MTAQRIMLTTTPEIPGYRITGLIAVVRGRSVRGTSVFKELAAGFTNLLGGRSKTLEAELAGADAEAMANLTDNAKALGADAVIGVVLDTEPVNLGSKGVMFLVTATGTAVTVNPLD